ncbi:rhombosortase [Neiella marina]|uniref:Rhombosortase n=1 Tax=Neiella holothuriorum TaxID=2870530 RepID=A0ABS7EL01_9GAMM|nr:rhombosortase [Neiella holothuriorum]MBW8192367.1 rhombosortase [Neiella holothuriorum]
MRIKHSNVLWLSLIPIIAIGLHFRWPSNAPYLAIHANQPLSSQWWTLISAPLAHTNGYHLVMNLMAYVIIAQLSDTALRSWRMPLVTLCLGALSSLGFIMGDSGLTSLVGLSGALHGVVAYLVIREFNSARLFMAVLATGLVIKLIAEGYWGGSEVTSQLIDAQVATSNHLVGAIAGALLAILLQLIVRSKHQASD